MEYERIIVSTSYLPPLGYTLALMRAGEVFVDLHETYPKQTCRNHCNIYGPNGKQVLSVPVRKTMGNHTPTLEIIPVNEIPWQNIHWRSIEAAYSNSPFFQFYQDDFLPFFTKKYDFLVDLNSDILSAVMRILHIECKVSFTSSYVRHPEGLTDRRTDLTSKHSVLMTPPYSQTFSEKHGFIPNLSIIDLIFNLGPEAEGYLRAIPEK
jgi:hypothetical protein